MDAAKKNFRRFQQRANQNLGLAEKTQVVTTELHSIEDRTEAIVECLTHARQKLSESLRSRSKEENFDKRKKKLVEFHLGQTFLNDASCLENVLSDGLLSQILTLYGTGLLSISEELVQSELNIERRIFDNLLRYAEEYKSVVLQKEKMKNSVLDMDSVRSRLTSAQNKGERCEQLQEELDANFNKVENCKDLWALELYTLAGKEIDMSNTFLVMAKLQLDFYKTACKTLEDILPLIQMKIDQYPRRPVYGCPLVDHLRYSKRDISVVLEVCCAALCELGLREEGLFRISGSVTKIKKLKAAFDIDEIDLTELDNHQHSIAGALKLYLRELPDPLMTHNLYFDWLKATCIENTETRLRSIKDVLLHLPQANFLNLNFLIRFLSKVAENQHFTKMSSQNLAIVIAPNVLWSPHSDGNFSDNATLANLVDCLISNVDFFFPGDIKFVSPKIAGLINKTGGFSDESNFHTATSKQNLMEESMRSITPPSDDNASLTASNPLTRRSPVIANFVVSTTTPSGGGSFVGGVPISGASVVSNATSSSLSRRPKHPAPPPPPPKSSATKGGGDRTSAPATSTDSSGVPPDDPTASPVPFTQAVVGCKGDRTPPPSSIFSHRKTLSLADNKTSNNQEVDPMPKTSKAVQAVTDCFATSETNRQPGRPPQPDKEKLLERHGSGVHRSLKPANDPNSCDIASSANYANEDENSGETDTKTPCKKPLAKMIFSSQAHSANNHTTTLEIHDDTGPGSVHSVTKKLANLNVNGAKSAADTNTVCFDANKKVKNSKGTDGEMLWHSSSSVRRRQPSEQQMTSSTLTPPSAAPRLSMKKMVMQIEEESLQNQGLSYCSQNDELTSHNSGSNPTVPLRSKPPVPFKPISGKSEETSEPIAPLANLTRL